jgi:hypothetical protein
MFAHYCAISTSRTLRPISSPSNWADGQGEIRFHDTCCHPQFVALQLRQKTFGRFAVGYSRVVFVMVRRLPTAVLEAIASYALRLAEFLHYLKS